MTWLGALPVFLVLLGVVLGPGAAVLAALGIRGLPLLALAAPASAGLLGAGAVVLGLLGVPWEVWAVPVLVVIGVGAAALLRRLGRPVVLGGRNRDSLDLRTLAGGAVAAVVAAVPLVLGMRRVDRPPQTYDAVFHLNALRYVEDTGRASSLLLGGMIDDITERGFYPAGWHVLGGSVVDLLGADPAAVANLMTLVLAAVVLPAGFALCARVLLPQWRWAAAIGAVSGSFFAALPVLMVTYGTLWPNAWATGVLPALLAATVLCLRRPDASSWLAVGLAAVGTVLFHPSAMFGFAILVLPFVLQALVRRWQRLRGEAHARRAVVEAGVLAACVVVGLAVLATSDMLTAIRQRVRPPVETMAQAVGEALFDAPLSGVGYGLPGASWLLGALVVLGAAVAARQPDRRPWVWSLALAVGAFAISAGAAPDSFLREYVTGFWYNDPVRLAGQVTVVAAPLAAVGIWALAVWLRRTATESGWLGSRSRLERLAGAWGIPVLVLAVLLATDGGYADRRQDRIAFDYWPDPADEIRQLVTPEEEELLRSLSADTPEDAVILADPFSGGALAYALGDRDVVFPHMPGNYDQDALDLRSLMPDLTDPEACRLVEELGIDYFYVDRNPYFKGGVGQRKYARLDLVPVSGVRLLERADSAALYEITACD